MKPTISCVLDKGYDIHVDVKRKDAADVLLMLAYLGASLFDEQTGLLEHCREVVEAIRDNGLENNVDLHALLAMARQYQPDIHVSFFGSKEQAESAKDGVDEAGNRAVLRAEITEVAPNVTGVQSCAIGPADYLFIVWAVAIRRLQKNVEDVGVDDYWDFLAVNIPTMVERSRVARDKSNASYKA